MPWYWPFHSNDERLISNSSTLFSAINDDTLLLIILIASIVGLWIYYSRRHRLTTIHPDNRQDVELLRQRNEEIFNRTATGSLHLGRSRQDTCPICLNDESVLSVETNCGHLFCGKCIIEYWKFQSNWMSGLTCPVCRQQVTVLLTCFTHQEQTLDDLTPDRQYVVTNVKDFNRRFSGASRSLREYFYDIPVLIPYIIRQIFSTEGLALAYRLRTFLVFITVALYVISPLDLLPESILGIFGLLDDVLVVICASLFVIISFRQSLARG